MGDGEWYWYLRHRQVEPFHGCRAEDRLGPYATRGEASDALTRVRSRNKQWDREDEEWDGDEPS